MERRNSLVVLLIVFVLVAGYSLLRGGNVTEAVAGGVFMGLIAVLLINYGQARIQR